MKRLSFWAYAIILLIPAYVFQSCQDDGDSTYLWRPTALVTVRPAAGNGFTLQLDDETTLYPSNISVSPYGDKEVRALVNYTDEGGRGDVRSVRINWMDSIRTKKPVPTLGADDDARYGKDAIEIVRDWGTVAEDGYLTLRLRTRWGHRNTPHYVYLVSGVNPDNPYEFELRHDAKGDTEGIMGDALIAFNLNGLPENEGQEIRLKLNWKSFSGKKSAEFDLKLRPVTYKDDSFDDITRNSLIK